MDHSFVAHLEYGLLSSGICGRGFTLLIYIPKGSWSHKKRSAVSLVAQRSLKELSAVAYDLSAIAVDLSLISDGRPTSAQQSFKGRRKEFSLRWSFSDRWAVFQRSLSDRNGR